MATVTQMEKYEKTSTIDWIVDNLKKRITSGEYAIGSRLPTQLELARSMNVGRSSVREAMRELQALGLIELKVGSGAYVRSDSITAESAIKWFRENEMLLNDLFEVRLAIEPVAVRLAALRATNAEIALLRRICEVFARAAAEADVDGLVRHDEEFHTHIVTCSHNPLFAQMNEIITGAFRKYRQRSFRIPATMQNAVEPHWDIFNAINARDAAAAVLHMNRHLEISVRDVSDAAGGQE
jgi:Transcriptional regulators